MSTIFCIYNLNEYDFSYSASLGNKWDIKIHIISLSHLSS